MFYVQNIHIDLYVLKALRYLFQVQANEYEYHVAPFTNKVLFEFQHR